MPPASRPALALVAMLLLAGCLGTEEPQDIGVAGGEDPSTPPVPTRDPPGDKDADGKADDAAPAADPAPAPVTTPISWDGKLAASACLPVWPNTCMFPVGLPGDEERMKEFDVPGNVTKASLTVTWTPSSPLTEEMRAVLLFVKTCGDGCWDGRPAGDAVVGASPLVLDADVPVPEEGETLGVYVDQARVTPPPIYAFARTEQPFHVEGTVTSVA